jgi:hypothetical protein
VLVATGLRDELPDILGLADRWARDVLHCPYCHAPPPNGRELAARDIGTVEGTIDQLVEDEVRGAIRAYNHGHTP